MMRDKLAKVIDDTYEASRGGEVTNCPQIADAIIAALPGMVPELEWRKSAINPWDGDYHTVPTWATIRGLGNEDYKLIYPGGFSVHNSPIAAQAAANAHHRAAFMRALGV